MSMDYPDKIEWRKIVLAQYSLFGTIAGLEVGSLSIFTSLLTPPVSTIIKIIFTLVSIALLTIIPLILYMINEERKIAYNTPNKWFIDNENTLRKILNVSMVLSWLLIILLFTVTIWSYKTNLKVNSHTYNHGFQYNQRYRMPVK